MQSARAHTIDAATHARAARLEIENHEHRPTRRVSLLLSWARGWITSPRRPAAEPLPDVGRGELAITFVGHATVLLRYANLCIVCDPMLGRWLGPAPRVLLPGLSPADMRDVDLVLLSHAHPGHLHKPTLRRLPRSATIVVPPRCSSLVSNLGFARVVELGIGHSVQHRRVDIAATPVCHESGRRAACAYVIRGDGPSAFFCGDSGYFSGFAEVGRRYAPEIAILPIAGYLPRSFRERHMTPADALAAFEDLGARMLVPIHWGAFELSYETLEDPVLWLRELVVKRGLDDYVTILDAGGSTKFLRPPAAP